MRAWSISLTAALVWCSYVPAVHAQQPYPLWQPPTSQPGGAAPFFTPDPRSPLPTPQFAPVQPAQQPLSAPAPHEEIPAGQPTPTSEHASAPDIERYHALKNNINDIQLYFQNDMRFLEQF